MTNTIKPRWKSLLSEFELEWRFSGLALRIVIAVMRDVFIRHFLKYYSWNDPKYRVLC